MSMTETEKKTAKRKPVGIQLAPSDAEFLDATCEKECRTRGELLSLWIQEKRLREEGQQV